MSGTAWKTTMINEILKNLGLNDKEITVYLALLPLGSSPASVLAQRTGITRSTAQYTCQQLVKRGLFRTIQKHGTFIYYPEPPEKLLYILKGEEKLIESKEKMLGKILPGLIQMRNPEANLPKVQFFEGIDGVIKLLNDHLPERGDLFGTFHTTGDIDKRIMNYFFEEYIEVRSKKLSNAWIIYSDYPMTREYRKKTKARYPNTRGIFIDPEEFPFDSDFMIYGTKTAHYTLRKNQEMGVIIDNADLTLTQKSFFRMAWNYLVHSEENKHLNYDKI
jgi:HTH-type transcriptional regulator, sugar sensing transcriptional regulator